MVPEKSKSTKRKSSTTVDEEVKEEEEEEEETNDNSTSKRLKSKSPKPKRLRCAHCKQFEDEVKEVEIPNEINSSRLLCENEFDLIGDEKLSLVCLGNDGDDASFSEIEVKVTQFSFYNQKCGHMIPLEFVDAKSAAMCGYVQNLLSDDEVDETNARPVKNFEVIAPWMFNSIDNDEKNIVGVSSNNLENMHFYLGEPSTKYRDIYISYKELSYLIKAVQSILISDPDLSFEKFLQELNDYDVPEDVGILTEDSLLRHAKFVLAHCESLDEYRDDDEVALLETNALKTLQRQTGLTPVKGKGHGRTRREKKEPPKSLNVKATTTPIIREIFEGSVFHDTIRSEEEQNAGVTKRSRASHGCGKCPNCVREDCGECTNCKDMKRHGGNGKLKQKCAMKICQNVMDAENGSTDDCDFPASTDDGDFPATTYETKNNRRPTTKRRRQDETSEEINEFFNYDGINKRALCMEKWKVKVNEETNDVYHSLHLNNSTLNVNDFVVVHVSFDQNVVCIEGCVRYFSRCSDTGVFTAHVSWLQSAEESILGVVADKNEYFFNGKCEDIDINKIKLSKNIIFYDGPNDWKTSGGESDVERMPKCRFVRQWYDDSTFRFYYPTVLSDPMDHRFCPDCRMKKSSAFQITMEKINTDGSASLTNIKMGGDEYSVDDDVLLQPDAFKFDYRPSTNKRNEKFVSPKDVYDEDVYPERWRKTDYVRGSNKGVPLPFKIGRIVKIFMDRYAAERVHSDGCEPDFEAIKIVVRKFYRTDDVGRTIGDEYSARRLYWSDEKATVQLKDVVGKCLVLSDLDYSPLTSLDNYLEGGPKRFFFQETFLGENNSFEVAPRLAQKLNVSVGKIQFDEPKELLEPIPNAYPTISRPLRSMDLFAGCGGLSRGFHDAGLADTRWAVEFDATAAKAFKKNFKQAIVYKTDCNVLLEALMKGEDDLEGQKLPKKGDIELLCGGPPCQGFSGMNRFTKGEYAKFRNSLVVTFLGFVDVLRPRFVVMENVRPFVSYKQSMVLKLCLRTLQRLGYQSTFGVLQAGSYGVPQTRRRAFLIAAAPNEILPVFPFPTHCFAERGLHLVVNIGNRRYELPQIFTSGSAPFTTVTVEKACSDLPSIVGNETFSEMRYKTEPNSYFQKLVRKNASNRLYDHVTRYVTPLNAARIEHIPKTPGADWRDLPNICCKKTFKKDKKSGEQTLVIEKLEYNFGPIKGRRKTGVCSCNEGRTCKYRNSKQENTLIPWCLPHTSTRHNNWAGLFGRIDWNGYFSTVVTNPDPMGKQGRVLHPEDNRIVSVREHARAQGFPDCHRFEGDVLRCYRQVGNAVPPPLAQALGREIKLCVATKEAANGEMKKFD